MNETYGRTDEEVINEAAKAIGLTCTINERRESNCPFCTYPTWMVTFTHTSEWSDNTKTYKRAKVNIHNFIELGQVKSLKGDMDIAFFKTLEELRTELIEIFNMEHTKPS